MLFRSRAVRIGSAGKSFSLTGWKVGYVTAAPEVMKAIAKTLGVKIAVSNVTFDNIIPGLQAKRYDIGNSSFTDNTSREKQVNFVTYFQAGEGFYAKKGANINVTSLTSASARTEIDVTSSVPPAVITPAASRVS